MFSEKSRLVNTDSFFSMSIYQYILYLPYGYPELFYIYAYTWKLFKIYKRSLEKSILFFSSSCVDLVAELSANPKAHKEVISLIPLLSHAAHYKHYTQHLHLLETVCTQVANLKMSAIIFNNKDILPLLYKYQYCLFCLLVIYT